MAHQLFTGLTASKMRSWLENARVPALLCLGNRLALALVVYAGLVVMPDVDHTLRPFPENLLLDGWFRWDAGHYFAIAQDGYQPIPDSVQQRTNFWPFYPLLVRVADWGVGNTFIAGLLVSNLALLCSCIMLYRWTHRRFGQDVATRTITLLLCFPFSFFMSAMYTESVFLCAVVGAFYFSQGQRWLLASLCAAMAGATRLVGVLVLLPVALSYAEHYRWKLSAFRRDVLWLPVGLAGTLGYMLFLHLRFGEGLAFLRTQWVPGWGGDATWSRLALALSKVTDWHHVATGNFESVAVINLAFGLVALSVCLVGFRRLGLAAGTWGVVTMLISLRIWASAGRYAAVVWPTYVGLALLTRGRPMLYQGIVTLLCLLEALLAFWFAHGHWVA
jgi:hypothetical protein